MITKYKARLVARGDLAHPGINGVYACTLAYKTLRILIAIITYFSWTTLQLDIETATSTRPYRKTSRSTSQDPQAMKKNEPAGMSSVLCTVYVNPQDYGTMLSRASSSTRASKASPKTNVSLSKTTA